MCFISPWGLKNSHLNTADLFRFNFIKQFNIKILPVSSFSPSFQIPIGVIFALFFLFWKMLSISSYSFPIVSSSFYYCPFSLFSLCLSIFHCTLSWRAPRIESKIKISKNIFEYNMYQVILNDFFFIFNSLKIFLQVYPSMKLIFLTDINFTEIINIRPDNE